jgi:hypothetical protein
MIDRLKSGDLIIYTQHRMDAKTPQTQKGTIQYATELNYYIGWEHSEVSASSYEKIMIHRLMDEGNLEIDRKLIRNKKLNLILNG